MFKIRSAFVTSKTLSELEMSFYAVRIFRSLGHRWVQIWFRCKLCLPFRIYVHKPSQHLTAQTILAYNWVISKISEISRIYKDNQDSIFRNYSLFPGLSVPWFIQRRKVSPVLRTLQVEGLIIAWGGRERGILSLLEGLWIQKAGQRDVKGGF